MKFVAKEKFRHGHVTYEPGNTYQHHGLSDEEVMSFHAAGWAEVEGQDPAPERQVRGVIVRPHKTGHKTEAQS